MYIYIIIFIAFPATIFAQSGSPITPQSGKLPINKLPEAAKIYLHGHKIKGAAYDYTNSDTTYYVSSKINGTRYEATFNAAGNLESCIEYRNETLMGIAIIFTILVLFQSTM